MLGKHAAIRLERKMAMTCVVVMRSSLASLVMNLTHCCAALRCAALWHGVVG